MFWLAHDLIKYIMRKELPPLSIKVDIEKNSVLRQFCASMEMKLIFNFIDYTFR